MALPASDNFNRANANPIGGNWTGVTNNMKIVSNAAQGTNGGAFNSAYWNADAFANDQYSQVTVATSVDGGPAVRLSGTNNWYFFEGKTPGNSQIGKIVAGAQTNLQAVAAAASGSVLKINVVGTTIQVFKGGVQQGTDQSDSSLASGSAGLADFAGATVFDDWSGDNIGGIAFDAASNSGEQLAQSSYSWNHTCTGANRYLKVAIGMLSLAQTVSGITYNGVALTFLGAQSSVSGAARIELWGLAAPTTGTNSIAVTLTGAVNSGGVASSYTGVHQTSSTEGFNSAQATNVGAADATVDVTTVANNDWVVDGVVTDDTAITVGAGQTSRNNISGTVGSVADSDEGPKTPAGAVTMSWTNIGAAATWAIAGIALRPIAAANLTSSSLLTLLGAG